MATQNHDPRSYFSNNPIEGYQNRLRYLFKKRSLAHYVEFLKLEEFYFRCLLYMKTQAETGREEILQNMSYATQLDDFKIHAFPPDYQFKFKDPKGYKY